MVSFFYTSGNVDFRLQSPRVAADANPNDLVCVKVVTGATTPGVTVRHHSVL